MKEYYNNKKIKKNFNVEELSDPPPSYSHGAGSHAINSIEHDIDLAPNDVGYGSTSTPSAVVDDSSTRPLLSGQAPGNVYNVAQGYQEVLFSRFVRIFFLLGCCLLFLIVSISLGVILLSTDGNLDDFSPAGYDVLSVYFITTVIIGGILPLAAIVPLLNCCCFLGIKSPQCNYCIRITFYISTAFIGSILFVAMLGETLMYLFTIGITNTTSFTAYTIYMHGSKVGYFGALTCMNFVAAIFGLILFITAICACVKDPQRNCSNQFIQACIYITVLILSGSLAFVMTLLPIVAMTNVEFIPFGQDFSKVSALLTYSLAAITCSGAHLVLVLLLVCLIGPLFCILEVRDSPFFSTILKYVMALSWIISFTLFASGVLSIIGSYLTHEHRDDLVVLNLRPVMVVAVFSLSAVVNFILAVTITIVWFLFTCSSCVHAIVLCCCLFCNL